jgi:hypothetical protein
VSEIFDMEVKELVTLSPARQDHKRNEGRFSQEMIRDYRELYYAGLPAWSPLWKVSDDSTVAMMRPFTATSNHAQRDASTGATGACEIKRPDLLPILTFGSFILAGD